MGNLGVVDELLATGFVRHDPTATEGEVRGPDGFRGFATASKQQYPYLRIPATFFEYWTALAEGDMVVTRWTARSTQGELKGDAPTGNEVSVLRHHHHPHLRRQGRRRVARV